MEAAIGRRVRRARRARDVTQSQLAVQTGLNVTTISRLENGTAKETYADTIVVLARALGVSADYLLGLSEREAGGVTDTVTDMTVTDPSHLRRMLVQEMVSVRLPRSVVAKIDAHVERIQRENPSLPVNRAHAVIYLVYRAEAPAADVTDTVTDTSPLRLLIQQEIRALKAGTVTDTSPLRRMIGQEFEDFLESRTALLKSIDHAQPVTDTVTDTPAQAEAVGTVPGAGHVTDTVTDTETVPDTVPDTEAPQKPSRRRKRQQVSA